MHAGFRVDGGPDIGYGHLIRSGTLARELLSRGHSATIVTATPDPAQSVFTSDAQIAELPTRDDPAPFVDWIREANPDTVFTDAYPADSTYQRDVRKCVPLAVLQDDARHSVYADLFINGNLYAADLNYEFAGPPPNSCLGPEYALLREEICRLAAEEPPWLDRPERALITMGGSDAANKTPGAIKSFDGFDLTVDAIVGPGFSEVQEREIRTTASDVSADVRVARDPDDLPKRMFQADFAVCTASSSTYELLALGTPIISTPVVDNQELIARALDDRDLGIVLSRGAGTESFQAAIEEYLSRPSLRRTRRERGRELIDGRGTQRVCSELLSVAKGNYEYDR